MSSPPKVLIVDIETAPSLAYVWSCFQDGVPFEMMKEEGVILMWAAKWYKKSEVFYECNTRFTEASQKRCLKSLWEKMDEADIVVAHNGDRFDIPTMNGYFLRNGFTPPSDFRTVDTLKIARSRFKFASNRLDHLGKTLGLGRKVTHNGFKLWLGCMNGDQKAWRTMIRYNIQDVKLLEKIYKKFLPWIKNHPNLGVFIDPDRPTCRVCGSSHVVKKGVECTGLGTYRRFRCMDCGAPLRGRQNELKKNPNILV